MFLDQDQVQCEKPQSVFFAMCMISFLENTNITHTTHALLLSSNLQRFIQMDTDEIITSTKEDKRKDPGIFQILM